MHSLVGQIQLASDAAKGGAARLSGIAPPSMPDTETTYDDLKARIAKTLAFVESIKPDQISDDLERTIELPLPKGTMTFTAKDFVLTYALPNFMFHRSEEHTPELLSRRNLVCRLLLEKKI